jgi:hypothetical protein
MTDNLKERGVQDRARIDVSEEHECRYWSKRFDVTPRELQDAVAQIGPMVEDVREWFNRQNA